MGYKIITIRDETADIIFRFRDDAPEKIKIDHGPYSLELSRDEGPFATTEREWRKIFSHLGIFEPVEPDHNGSGDSPQEEVEEDDSDWS